MVNGTPIGPCLQPYGNNGMMGDNGSLRFICGGSVASGTIYDSVDCSGTEMVNATVSEITVESGRSTCPYVQYKAVESSDGNYQQRMPPIVSLFHELGMFGTILLSIRVLFDSVVMHKVAQQQFDAKHKEREQKLLLVPLCGADGAQLVHRLAMR